MITLADALLPWRKAMILGAIRATALFQKLHQERFLHVGAIGCLVVDARSITIKNGVGHGNVASHWQRMH